MEVMSCSSSQGAEQVETHGGLTMDEMLLDVDVEEAAVNESVLNPELDGLNAEKHSTTDVVIEETENLGGDNVEGESSSPSEPKWLQQDEPVALWVKWRGKWQAGIRCARADWPLTTLRGKPTHDRKKYYVIFFPHTKNYSWADMQLVRSIYEFPDPIAYKSHKVGVKMVKDLTVARRNIMRKLTIGMLNIVDQFHSEVVVESGNDIIFWKEFAMEASRSTSYQELGRMLVKLHSMILQRYMDPNWLENSFPSWAQRCNDAMNAESVELLKEEFDNCIQWNQVKSISDPQMQLMVLSEWKTWKHDVTKWFSISRRSVAEVAHEDSNKSIFNSDVQASHKRPKLEIRRAETTNTSSQMEPDTSPQENTNAPVVVMKDEDVIMNTPVNGTDLWDGIVVEASGSQLVKTRETNDLSLTVVKKPFGSGNKSQQCTAFIESKGRQCVRWANEGDIYCCVHLASRFATKAIKSEASPAAAEAPMCGGVTVLGTKCKHRSLPGMLYCKKHRPHTEMVVMTPDNNSSSHLLVKRKAAEMIEATQYQDVVVVPPPPFVPNGTTTSFTEMLEHCSNEDSLCVGSCSENSYVPCNEFATKHTLYCEQHLPNWLKRARNGKSRIDESAYVDTFQEKDTKKKKNDNALRERKLSATFQDLPAPLLHWEKMSAAPVPRLDGAAIQIRNFLYVFAGYGNINLVHSHVDVYNFVDNTWGGRFDMPKEMAHSHLGMVTDGRFIYIVTGQYGPQCRGPTAKTFVLDTDTNTWSDFIPLPVPRYAPATQLWRGRLHVMGGSKENRHTPGLEHWSIAVKDGKALEKEWRSEIPIPRGGPHRACVVVDDRLFVIGGQEGDFMAKPGSPIFKCSRRLEVVFSDVYMLDEEMKWKVMPSMPKPDSHIEFAWKVVNNSIVIVGGTTEKHPETKKMVLVGEIFQFNLNTMKWYVIGKLPYRVKTTLVGYWEGNLYFTSGQRDKGPDDPAPRKVIAEMWRTKLILTP